LDFFSISFEEVENLDGCACCLARRILSALKKKAEPFFLNTLGANSLKQIVVALAVGFEVKTAVAA
jgi:hypothetical protein